MRLFTVHAPLRPAAGGRLLDRTAGGRVADRAGSGRPADPYGLGADMAQAIDPAQGRVALVPEGFSLVAAIAPAVWMLWHRLWLALVLVVAVTVIAAWLLPAAFFPWVMVALQVLVGFHAQDIRRWTLARQGLAEVAVVAGRDEEAALLRLFAARPDLAEGLGA